uniref:Acetyl-coenzyme A carboxylase carboxyl transferase subunit beta n=1 Tax=Hildenbrandia rivularis TaxID=135206 RepID=A0A1C9CFL6_9FLOR|nr:acetyl-CoA carboxylase beta subunit [Hildenbrandia rivularis]AOM67165.1 acetyl-CoA carboxylase beta subunit [Hildenbrandia rivularis]
MCLSSWLIKKRSVLSKIGSQVSEITIPQDLWIKCDICGLLMYNQFLYKNLNVCPKCDNHFPMFSYDRISQIIDVGSWKPLDVKLRATDPLNFEDIKMYKHRLREMKKKTGLYDAVQTGIGKIVGIRVALGTMDFRFMGGSMGSVVGEKLTRLIEIATNNNLPVIVICASGGARMQEGVLSLMQMAKVSSALYKHRIKNLLYISVLTSPTTGGVTASFAMLGDFIIAEPSAVIAFAGRRVIEQTIKEDLPKNFHTSEYLFEHGFLDFIISRTKLRSKLSQILLLHHS